MVTSKHAFVVAPAIAAILMGVSSTAAGSLSSNVHSNAGQAPLANDSTRTGFVTTVDISGVPSMDFVGSPSNVVVFLQIGAGNALSGIGWDVVLQTVHPNSLLSDMHVLVTDSTGLGGFSLQPGFMDQNPGGPSSYDSDGQILKLADYSIPDIIAIGDGLLRLEFFDYVDDAVGVVDGQWVSGSLFLQTYGPFPNASTSSLLTLAGLSGLRRRRSA